MEQNSKENLHYKNIKMNKSSNTIFCVFLFFKLFKV